MEQPPNDRRATQKALWAEVEITRQKYHESHHAFDLLAKEVPSTVPAPDGALRLARAANIRRADYQNYMAALRELTAFLLNK